MKSFLKKQGAPQYPLYAVDEKTGEPYLELGKPNPAIPITQGTCGVYGRYTGDGKITFEGKCQNPWEFMATGTGLSGITITAGREITGQLNHSASYDEGGNHRSLGRFTLDWYDLAGFRFWTEKRFSGIEKKVRMVNDLRRSLITISSEGGNHGIRVEVRAHKELDVIRLDFFEESDLAFARGMLHLQLQKEYPFEARVENDVQLSWHVNQGGIIPGRCYGTAMTFDLPEGMSQRWTTGRAEVENMGLHSQAHYTLWIASGSHADGFDAWREDVLSRLKKSRADGEAFITSHEAWWKEFWERSSLELPGDDGSHLRHQAAFDLYRYYAACSTDRRREAPSPTFTDLFRFNELPNFWNSYYAMPFQGYQAFSPAVRFGDLNELAGEFELRFKLLPIMKRWGENNSPYHGCIHPYIQGVAQVYLGNGESQSGFADNCNFNGNLYWLVLVCDYLSLAGEDRRIEEGLLEWASGLLTFVSERYPNRTEKGAIDFTPSIGQEAYYDCSDSTELLVGLRMLLPRLLALGAKHHWDRDLLAKWQIMLEAQPELPRGKIVLNESDLEQSADLEKAGWPSYAVSYAPKKLNESERLELWRKRQAAGAYLNVPRPHVRMTLEESDTLAPVRKLNPEKSNFTSDESPELFSIWPGKLMLRNADDRRVAVKSYQERLFKQIPTGWQLDVAHAACLGLRDEVNAWWPYHFDTIFSFPCGLAQDLFNYMPDRPGITFAPTMEGLGNGVVPLVEMLMQDYPDLLIILPCWEPKVAVRYTLFSPYAGRVTVDYDPDQGAKVDTERKIKIEFGEGIKGR